MNRPVQVFWVALIVKLVLSAWLPLTNDEAYYWVWSKHPQLSYYDHPPFVAWLFTLGSWTSWIGSSVRWPGVLLAHAALALWMRVLKPYLSEAQLEVWLMLALLSPLVGGSGLIITPDVPLMFFYALSLWLYFKFKQAPSLTLASALGLAVGFGLTSKYMMVLFGLSLAPLIWIDLEQRRTFLKYLPVMVLGLVLGSMPVWLWNVRNEFASFKFQADHGLGRKVWKPSWTYEYILSQIGMVFPTVLVSAWRARKDLPREFAVMAFLPLVFFLFTTARGYAEANWPLVAYPALFALAVSLWPKNKFSLRATAALWALALSLFAGVIFVQPGWAARTKFREFHEFDAAVQVVRDLKPLYARNYQMAAKLSYELGRQIYKIKGMNRVDFYDFLPDSIPTEPEIYVVVQSDEWFGASVAANYNKTRVIPIDDRYEVWVMVRP